MSDAAPRDAARRRADTVSRLSTDIDAWVATAGSDGRPYLVPLSFLWHQETLLFATTAASPTVRNLRVTPHARVGIGPTRDVVLIEGDVQIVPRVELPADVGDSFATAAGFDPRQSRAEYVYLRVRPRLIQAWREENELAARVLMRAGRWLPL